MHKLSAWAGGYSFLAGYRYGVSPLLSESLLESAYFFG
jgi:hypothetical protein